MQIVRYNMVDKANNRYLQYCIPTDLDRELPLPKGYLSQSPIDDYENSVLHVKPKKVVYTDGTDSWSPYIRASDPDPDMDYRYPEWHYNGVSYARKHVSGGDGRVTWTHYAIVHYNQVRFMYRRECGSQPWGGSIPNFLKQEELVSWLLANGFYLIWTSTSWANTTVRSTRVVLPATKSVSWELARLCYQKMLLQSPPEPSCSTEFFELMSSLKCNTNTIANASEAISLVKSLINLKSLVKTGVRAGERLADLWLKYRYCYSTTKSDMAELKRYVSSLEAEQGTLRTAFSVGSSEMHLKVRYGPTANTMLRQVLSWYSGAARIGLNPSLYNLWDLVPFSFIADWFVPIGDNLERLQNMMWTSTMPYDVQCLASQKDTVTVDGLEYCVYTRYRYSPSYDMSWVDPNGTSLATWGKRGLDFIALTR